MNELTVFYNTEFGQIRTLIIKNEVYFVGKDVAEVLGYSNTRDALAKHVDDEDKNTVAIHDGTSGNPNTTVINESGLYSLILSSKLPKSKEFKRWVTSEVLPSIRKHGYYSVRDDETKAKLMRAHAMELNAQTRAFNSLMKSIDNKHLSPIAAEVFGLKALESTFGVNVNPYLPEVEKTYNATEVGKMLNISANMVGRIANTYGLKTAEYGIFKLDKSRYSNKEMENFNYNQKGVEKIRQIYKEINNKKEEEKAAE